MDRQGNKHNNDDNGHTYKHRHCTDTKLMISDAPLPICRCLQIFRYIRHCPGKSDHKFIGSNYSIKFSAAVNISQSPRLFRNKNELNDG